MTLFQEKVDIICTMGYQLKQMLFSLLGWIWGEPEEERRESRIQPLHC